jgi:hypothetical protein
VYWGYYRRWKQVEVVMGQVIIFEVEPEVGTVQVAILFAQIEAVVAAAQLVEESAKVPFVQGLQ